MGIVATQSNSNTPVDIGSVLQVQLSLTQINLNATIAGSGSVTSSVIATCGYKNFAFALTSSQSGSVSIQRYIDQAGTIPVGAAITGSITGATALDVHSTDSIPYQSMIITVNNSSGSTATLTNSLLLLQAN